MRIVINALSARLGGGQTYLHNLLEHAPPGLQELYLLAPDSLVLPRSDAPVVRLPTPRALRNPFLRSGWERFVLPGLLVKLRADLLFCPGGLINTTVPAGCRSVTMFRNMMPFDMAQRRRYPYGYQRLRLWLLERLMLRSMQAADRVIFISEHARSVIESRLGRRLARALVIPHGINPRFRADPRQPLPRPAWLPAEDYLLYVSTLDVYKSQIELVQGYALYRARHASAPKLILAGPDSTGYGRRLRREIARLRLENEVILAGKVPYYDLPALYQHALVNLFASQTENCPNILLEMLAAGRPALVSDRPPMPEFGGDAVAYFDPGRPQDLADELDRLLADPLRQAELANRAARRSLDFDWRVSAEKTWAALREMV